MEYVVAYGYGRTTEDAKTELEEEVSVLIEEGWEPQGGVSIAYNECGYIFSQAMILNQ